MRFNNAWRRSDAEPTTAPSGRSMIVVAALPMKASRTSSRGRKAESFSPAGICVAMSFDECTAMSIRPSMSAASISLVNKPLPPTSDSGPVEDAVAGGGNHLDEEGLLAKPMGSHQPRAHFACLCERQLAAAGADAEGLGIGHWAFPKS